MKVVIVNAYDRHNAGDAALLSALLGQVRTAFPAATISFAGLESAQRYPAFEGARNLGSLRRWVGEETVSRQRRVVRKAGAIGLALLPPPVWRWVAGRGGRIGAHEATGELRALVQADLVIGLGGGYLNGSPSMAGTLNVAFLLLPLWMATRMHTPTVLAPQSYGPFGRRLQVHLVRHCLNRVDRIEVREDVSVGHLRSAGVHMHLLRRGVDSAFALDDGSETVRSIDDTTPRPHVGITARAWLTGDAQDTYERSLAALVDWLHQTRGATVTLVPQVTSDYRGDDDRVVARRVASYCTTPPRVMDAQLDHRELRSVYGGLDYLVGTRFHSVIFSLTAGVPALAIGYEHKTAGIMRDLGLGSWVIPIHEATGPVLCERFAALERVRGDYERLLKERLPDYIERARGYVHVLRGSVA